MLKLKLQHVGHLMRRADSFEKTLMLGKIEGRKREWDGWMASPTQWTWVWVNSGSWWWTGRSGMLQFMGSQRIRHNWATELNWTDPWKKSYDQPRQNIKNQRYYFSNKGPASQSYGFSSSHVWMWELDYKAEHWRIDVFQLWWWRRLLRVPWTARRSNQSMWKEISPEY